MDGFASEYLRQVPGAFAVLGYASGLLLVSWPLFLLLERWVPVTPSSGSRYRFNWTVVVSNIVLTPLLYALAMTVGVLAARGLGSPFLPYPVIEVSVGVPALDLFLQGTVLFLIACVLGDAWYYLWHRMQHEIPALWEFHKLHHSDEEMNATTIFRSHFFELAGQALVRGLTMGLLVDLAAAPETVVAIVAVGILPTVWDVFIHSNVRIPWLGRLVPFFSTPQYHWIHHSKLPEHQDKNYAIWLPVYDVVFGSYFRPRTDEYPPTGLSSGERIETLWDAQAGPILAWFGPSAASKDRVVD